MLRGFVWSSGEVMSQEFEFGKLTQAVDTLSESFKDLKKDLKSIGPSVNLAISDGITHHEKEFHKKPSNPPTARATGSRPAWIDMTLKYIIPPLVAAALGAFGMQAADSSNSQTPVAHAGNK